MAVSDTDIANFALTRLGHAAIVNMTLDDSDEARAVNAIYTMCRDEVLAAHPWNFATRWSVLATIAGVPANPNYTARYQMPTNALKVWSLQTEGYSWVVEGQEILTDLASPVAQTTYRVTDSASFNPNFAMALAYRLAAELCNTLTARRGNAQDYWQLYAGKLQEAKTSDGMEGSPLLEDSNPLALARGSSPCECGDPQF
jgi:hypothetical protein